MIYNSISLKLTAKTINKKLEIEQKYIVEVKYELNNYVFHNN
ncbi:hypothetical protein Leryth_025437 [Lithospermum erythrorhizon]|nr:hypothetical protein Leryth_025437 [Lithospermum erythrorhizon]